VTTNPVAAERPPIEQPGVVATPPQIEEPIRPALTINVEAVAWLAVLLAVPLFRLTDLAALPLRPDEGLRAQAALDFARGTPTADWGGDLASALTALRSASWATPDFTARLPSALLGTAAVGALWLYRPLIGRAAALIAALLLACSGVAVLARAAPARSPLPWRLVCSFRRWLLRSG
jgi:hypothetical protein